MPDSLTEVEFELRAQRPRSIVFDAVFRFLFTFSPAVYSQGEIRFAASTGSYLAAAAVAVAVVLAIAGYRSGRGRPRDRVALTAIRLALLAVILLCLFRPLLIVKAAVSQQNFVGVLLDDSRSMQISDQDGGSRGAFVKTQFGAGDRGVLKAISDRFTTRVFRFSSGANRITNENELTFSGSQTRLGAALSNVRQELAGLPVAGLVMVTDGADTADAALGDALLALKADGLPVYTVGVGRETLPKDIQVGRVVTPKVALKGTTLMVDVVLSQNGFDGQKVTLDVEDEGHMVSTQEVTLPDAGTPASIPVRFTVSEAGPRVLRFRVSPQAGELVTENNARESLIDVRDRPERILYFEGEPRFEMKFIRRAVTEDKNVQVVALQRTADNKFLRLFVDAPESPDELVAGFPKTREELFCLPRTHPRQHRGQRVQRRSAPHDRRLRGSARRRIDHARRSARVCRGRIRRHGGGRCPAGAARSESGAAQGHGHSTVGVQADPRRQRHRGDAAWRQRSRLGRALVDVARCHGGESHRGDQARRDRAAHRSGRDPSRSPDARLSALRSRQSVRVYATGLVGLANARHHSSGRHDARELLASIAALGS